MSCGARHPRGAASARTEGRTAEGAPAEGATATARTVGIAVGTAVVAALVVVGVVCVLSAVGVRVVGVVRPGSAAPPQAREGGGDGVGGIVWAHDSDFTCDLTCIENACHTACTCNMTSKDI